jgi:hypothetical protein
VSSGVRAVAGDTAFELGESVRLIDGLLLFVDLLQRSLFRIDPQAPQMRAELMFQARSPLGAPSRRAVRCSVQTPKARTGHPMA